MTQDIPPDARDRASVLFSDLIEGHWEKADRELDASLRGQVHLDRWFARAWAKAADSVRQLRAHRCRVRPAVRRLHRGGCPAGFRGRRGNRGSRLRP